MRRANGTYLLFAITISIWPTGAHALSDRDKEAIRLLSNQAALDYAEEHFEPALDKFQRAYTIAKVPKFAVWLARVNDQLGRLVAAVELYREALALQPNDLWQGNMQQLAQQDARDELDRLLPRVPRLTILLQGVSASEVSLMVDDATVPSDLIGVERPVDPGPHEIVIRRGSDTQRESINLTKGSSKTVTFRFGSGVTQADAPATGLAPDGASNAMPPALAAPNRQESGQTGGAPRSDPQQTWGWVGLGLGAAGVVLGATTGVMVAAKNADLKRQCSSNHVCGAEYASDVNSYSRLQTLSTTGFIVGGLGAAAGVTLLLTSGREASSANVGLWLTPNVAGVKGAF